MDDKIITICIFAIALLLQYLWGRRRLKKFCRRMEERKQEKIQISCKLKGDKEIWICDCIEYQEFGDCTHVKGVKNFFKEGE